MQDRNRSPTEKPSDLLTDAVESFELEQLTDKTVVGPRRIKGVAKEADKINLNRRYFSLDVLTAMVTAAQDDVTAGNLYGLAGHPDWFDGPKGAMENIVIKYDKLTMDGKLMRFEGTIVQTVKGKDLQAVLDAGIKVGMSTNVTGSSKYLPAKELDAAWPYAEDLIQVVQDDARLRTIDAVMMPADDAGEVSAADSARGEPPMDLKTLKDKYPELVKQIEDSAKPAAGAQSLEDALAAERTERLKLEQRLSDDARRAMVTRALADAKLPKLGKSGDIDLDANFAARVEKAALTAKTDEEAQTEVNNLIADRKAVLKVRGEEPETETTDSANTPGLGDAATNGAKGKPAPKGKSTLRGARSSLGL